ncbi:phosphatidylserine decarboxylase [Legionella waltersii]|uniref:Phosphatidylserine decarboxylase proenzyme n=1 Tax=Legionella waltersii TaxID=66969 RepID=A0A0W1A524_9GAMM|nr:phosphatidylserine decarboxylase [Legionella waltersii]
MVFLFIEQQGMSSDFIKTFPQYLLPKQLLTMIAGCLAKVKQEKFKNYIIEQFINTYGVNMKEALIENPKEFACFNDFFIRHLKPESRPLADADIVCPVDGCVSEIGSIQEGQLMQAKGKYYSVKELLVCDESTAKQFVNGKFATLYLSPKDYHRVHMPVDAELLSMSYVPGALFSVQPSTARVIPKLFARNERLVIHFQTHLGPMVMVMVGATIVGAIGTSWGGDVNRSHQSKQVVYPKDFKHRLLSQGEEMGYFKLGSTVVLLFAEGDNVQWSADFIAGRSIRMGENMGVSMGLNGTEKRTRTSTELPPLAPEASVSTNSTTSA